VVNSFFKEFKGILRNLREFWGILKNFKKIKEFKGM